MSSNTIVKTVQSDTGDIILPIPTEILSQLGWVEGTELWWVEEDDKIILREKNAASEE